jgi:hypothetical protein
VVRYARPGPLPEPPATETQTRAERDSWSELMKLTFGLDALACSRCGSRMRYIATISIAGWRAAFWSTCTCLRALRLSRRRANRHHSGRQRKAGTEGVVAGTRKVSLHGRGQR